MPRKNVTRVCVFQILFLYLQYGNTHSAPRYLLKILKTYGYVERKNERGEQRGEQCGEQR